MSRLDLLVLFIFAFFHCIRSSASQHADIDADNASNNNSSDSNIIFSNSEYFEDDSILLPGDANASGIVPGKLPNDIINPSSDCVEDGAGSSEGKVAVENEDAIAISDGGDVKLGKKNVTKESKTKRPCKTAHKADHDKQRGNRNDTSNGTFTSLKDPDDNSPGGMNMTGIITISLIVSVLLVMIIVVVVVVRYKKIDVVALCGWKKSDKVSRDVEMGDRAGDSSGTGLSPDDSSTQLLNETGENAESREATGAAAFKSQFSTDSGAEQYHSLPDVDPNLSERRHPVPRLQKQVSTVSEQSAYFSLTEKPQSLTGIAEIPRFQTQLSTDSEQYFSLLPCGPQSSNFQDAPSLSGNDSFKSGADPQGQLSDPYGETVFEASGPPGLPYMGPGALSADSGSVAHSDDKESCENNSKDKEFQKKIDGHAINKKWEERVSMPTDEEATDAKSEQSGVSWVPDSIKKLFQKK